MTSIKYTQNDPTYLAVQWLNGTDGGDDFDTFITNFTEDPSRFSVNDKGDLVFNPGGGPAYSSAIGTWFVSPPLWDSSVTTWQVNASYNNDDFTAQFTAQ